MNIYYTVPVLTFLAVLCLLLGAELLRGSKSALGAWFAPYDSVFSVARHLSPVMLQYFPEERVDRYGARLLWAGSPMGLTADVLVGFKLLLGITAGGTGLLLTLVGVSPLVGIGAGIACFLFPDILLNERVTLRQWRITHDMPLMLGLLVTALRSGVEFGQAFSAIAETFPGALGDEMRVSWEMMATGTPRREALKVMAARTGVLNVRRFSETVAASSERGNDQFSLQLELLAKDALDALYKTAQEDARKKPALILLPLFLFILTPTLIMLLTPILMQISSMM